MKKQDMIKKLTKRTLNAWEFLQYTLKSKDYPQEAIQYYRHEWMVLEDTCRILGIKVNYPTNEGDNNATEE